MDIETSNTLSETLENEEEVILNKDNKELDAKDVFEGIENVMKRHGVEESKESMTKTEFEEIEEKIQNEKIAKEYQEKDKSEVISEIIELSKELYPGQRPNKDVKKNMNKNDIEVLLKLLNALKEEKYKRGE